MQKVTENKSLKKQEFNNMPDRHLYLAYVYLYNKLSNRLKLTRAPVLTEDGMLDDFSVNVYTETPHGDDAVCEMHIGMSEDGFSIITRLEDISVGTWIKKVYSDHFEDENYGKIYEIFLEQFVSAVNKGWVKLDKCNPKLLNDLIEHDLVYVETVQAYKLTEYSKRK